MLLNQRFRKSAGETTYANPYETPNIPKAQAKNCGYRPHQKRLPNSGDTAEIAAIISPEGMVKNRHHMDGGNRLGNVESMLNPTTMPTASKGPIPPTASSALNRAEKCSSHGATRNTNQGRGRFWVSVKSMQGACADSY